MQWRSFHGVMMAERLLTPRQVAGKLDLAPRHVRSLMRRQILPGVKLGHCWRVPESALKTYLVSLRARALRNIAHARAGRDRSQRSG